MNIEMALKWRSYILDLNRAKLSLGIFFFLSCLMESFCHQLLESTFIFVKNTHNKATNLMFCLILPVSQVPWWFLGVQCRFLGAVKSSRQSSQAYYSKNLKGIDQKLRCSDIPGPCALRWVSLKKVFKKKWYLVGLCSKLVSAGESSEKPIFFDIFFFFYQTQKSLKESYFSRIKKT